MENIFVEFLPPWIETGLQPAFYDKESGTVLQQTARMYARVNMLIRMFNKLSKNTKTTVEEYINKFNELYDYVHDYFDNLDVQEEINNKLDAMVEDGTLDQIINDEIFGEIQEEIAKNKKYKSEVIMICSKVSGGGDCYIIRFANGKNMFIDTGSPSDWSHIVNCLTELEISKFDYGIITHPHSDHNGNLANFIDNYCDENTVFYVGKTPDLNELIEVEANKYRDQNALFQLKGITPIEPVNNSTVAIDELSKTSIRFLNTDPSWFEDYYDINGEYYTDRQTDNVFSLVTEITFENVKFLSTGDIEKCVEDKLVNYVTKTELMTPPHHFGNKHINEQFYNNLDVDTFFVSSYNGSLLYGNIGYTKAVRENRNIISSYQSPYDYTIATTYGYNFSFTNANYKGLNIPKLYNNITELISSVHVVGGVENITLDILMDSMKIGDQINFYLDSTFTGLTTSICSALGVTSIPVNSNITLIKNSTTRATMTITLAGKKLGFTAFYNGTIWYCEGYGVGGTWTNETELLAIMNNLPVGTYELLYNGNEDHALGGLAGYMTLHITNITSTGYRKGYLEGVRNNGNFTIWFGNFTGASGGFSWKVIPWS